MAGRSALRGQHSGWTIRETTFEQAAAEDASRYLAMTPAERVRLVPELFAACLSTRGSVSLHDFAEFIRILNQRRVRYLIIGGYAVAFHGHPRATDDVDVLIASDEKNIRRVERALVDFVGVAPRPESLRSPQGMIRIGGPVTHIDVTTKVDGLAAFEPLWERRARGELLGEPTVYLSLRDLLRTKRAANRAKDQGDIVVLEAIQRAARRR